MSQANESPPRPEWPGLDLAYDLVRPAYDQALRRAEVAEARARATLGFSGTLMFAAPAFVAATLGGGQRSFASAWFIAGVLAFAGIIGCLIVQQLPRIVGEIRLVSMRELVDEGYLEDDPPAFKLNVVIYAADAWDTNRRHINNLGKLATASAILFGLQLAAFAGWVLHG